MFERKKTTAAGSTYYQVVENRRVNGRVQQRVLLSVPVDAGSLWHWVNDLTHSLEWFEKNRVKCREELKKLDAEIAATKRKLKRAAPVLAKLEAKSKSSD